MTRGQYGLYLEKDKNNILVLFFLLLLLKRSRSVQILFAIRNGVLLCFVIMQLVKQVWVGVAHTGAGHALETTGVDNQARDIGRCMTMRSIRT